MEPYIIRAFEEDNLASKFINEKAKEGYKLVSVSAAAVSSKERCTFPLVLRIVVTLFYPY